MDILLSLIQTKDLRVGKLSCEMNRQSYYAVTTWQICVQFKSVDQAAISKQTNKSVCGEISGSHGCKYEGDCLLGCCTM
jgi:hypothetical protein